MDCYAYKYNPSDVCDPFRGNSLSQIMMTRNLQSGKGEHLSAHCAADDYRKDEEEEASSSCLSFNLLQSIRHAPKRTIKRGQDEDGLPLMTRISPTSSSSSDQQDPCCLRRNNGEPSETKSCIKSGKQPQRKQPPVPLYHSPEAVVAVSPAAAGDGAHHSFRLSCLKPPGNAMLSKIKCQSKPDDDNDDMILESTVTDLIGTGAALRACDFSDLGSLADDSTDCHDDITVAHRNHMEDQHTSNQRHCHDLTKKRQQLSFSTNCLPSVFELRSTTDTDTTKEQPSIWRRMGVVRSHSSTNKHNDSVTSIKSQRHKNIAQDERRSPAADTGVLRLTTDMLKQHEQTAARVASPISCYEDDDLARDVIHKKDHYEHYVKKSHKNQRNSARAGAVHDCASSSTNSNILPLVKDQLKKIMTMKKEKGSKNHDASTTASAVQWERQPVLDNQNRWQQTKQSYQRGPSENHTKNTTNISSLNQFYAQDERELERQQQGLFIKWQQKKQEHIDRERIEQMRLAEVERQRRKQQRHQYQRQPQHHPEQVRQQKKVVATKSQLRSPPRRQVSF